MWTMDELIERVRAALATDRSGAPYPGAPNGRVRDVPDRRAIRWYATIGLVDRPAGMRGRIALYGRRHLLQLVAVKRLQAAGKSLADIQATLGGATDPALADVARVPAELLDGGAPEHSAGRSRFWAATPAPMGMPAPDEMTPPAPAPVRSAPPPAAGPGESPVEMLAAVDLGGGAVLVLPHPPGPDDLGALTEAARPLLTLLARRGLLNDGSTS